MADENQVHDDFQDESKRDTVQINLPQGGSGKAPFKPTPTVRLKPGGVASGAPATLDTKKATAAIALPVAPAQSKKDTSPVKVPASKPTVPEMPRPTVKLKREEPPAPAASVSEPVTAATEPAESDSATSLLDIGLAIAAMVVALAVAGYLFSLSRG